MNTIVIQTRTTSTQNAIRILKYYNSPPKANELVVRCLLAQATMKLNLALIKDKRIYDKISRPIAPAILVEMTSRKQLRAYYLVDVANA